jgi:type IV secretory pathway TrbD component
VLFRQGRAARSSQFGLLAIGVLILSFSLALTVGGTSVSERFQSLFADDPLAVYEQARGAQLRYTFAELLYEYPLGAGLGRWGVAAGYFGSSDPNIPPIWAEIQFTGWMIDGGILMIGLYLGALIATARSQLNLARSAQYPRLGTCAAVVLAAGLGPAVMIVSFTPFVAQIGIQYWFLAGALHGVACQYAVQDA